VQHPDDRAFDDERDPDQRADPLFTEQRVERLEGRIIEVGYDDRLFGGSYRSREASPDRQPEAAVHLLLETLCRTRRQRPAVVLDEQHRGRVDPEDLLDPVEQLAEQIVEVEVGERGVGQPLHVFEASDGLLLCERLPSRLLVDLIRRHRALSQRLGSQVPGLAADREGLALLGLLA
jgi:hypothetical protein